MLNYHHEPTGTTVATEASAASETTEWNELHVQSKFVSTRVTHYDSLGGWQAQSVHLHGPSQPTAKMNQRDDGTYYLTVKLGEHDNLFVPPPIAVAIARCIDEHSEALAKEVLS